MVVLSEYIPAPESDFLSIVGNENENNIYDVERWNGAPSPLILTSTGELIILPASI